MTMMMIVRIINNGMITIGSTSIITVTIMTIMTIIMIDANDDTNSDKNATENI